MIMNNLFESILQETEGESLPTYLQSTIMSAIRQLKNAIEESRDGIDQKSRDRVALLLKGASMHIEDAMRDLNE